MCYTPPFTHRLLRPCGLLALVLLATHAAAAEDLAVCAGSPIESGTFTADFSLIAERPVHLNYSITGTGKGTIRIRLQRKMPSGDWTTIEDHPNISKDGSTPTKRLPVGDYRIQVVGDHTTFSITAQAE